MEKLYTQTELDAILKYNTSAFNKNLVSSKTLISNPEINNEIENIFLDQDVIVRTINAGVFAGILKQKQAQQVILSNAKRIWSWSGACSLSQLAKEGTTKPTECKFAVTVDIVNLEQVIEILPLRQAAKISIYGAGEWRI